MVSNNIKNTKNKTGEERLAEKSLQQLLGGTFLIRDKAVSLLPFLFFLTFLATFYIANTYLAEKTIREIAKVKKEVKEFRYEYITTKSELMFYSKQTQVAKSLESTGIKESTKPPQKIIIETNR
ncbi:MAG: hypothetical protein KAV70_05595 [Bacteroidales bacterium]|nr:hypothetical protein [Bacteroidales bacterium]MCK4408424.1 hypothetical protein [Bacteroidales bacterium]